MSKMLLLPELYFLTSSKRIENVLRVILASSEVGKLETTDVSEQDRIRFHIRTERIYMAL